MSSSLEQSSPFALPRTGIDTRACCKCLAARITESARGLPPYKVSKKMIRPPPLCVHGIVHKTRLIINSQCDSCRVILAIVKVRLHPIRVILICRIWSIVKYHGALLHRLSINQTALCYAFSHDGLNYGYPGRHSILCNWQLFFSNIQMIK